MWLTGVSATTQISASFAADSRASRSSNRHRSASSARQVAPACFMVAIVFKPTTGTSKRMSWFGLATFTTVSARLNVDGSLPSEGDCMISPARRMVASVPSMASTATQAASAMTTVWPMSKRERWCATAGSRSAQQLLARKKGTYDIKVQYQLPVTKKDAESGVTLPVAYGLVNRLKLTVVNLDVDVLSPQAVSIQRDTADSNTVATLVLSPVNDAWVAWKPRSRDVKREKPVFYAEISQLYAPAAGVIEGAHYFSIRPAQGELSELVIDVPARTTITDVIDPAKPGVAADARQSASLVSLWRFDPDTRKLRVTLNPPQSHTFGLLVRSQVATGPLPFEQSVGLLAVDNAAGQIGLLGIATGHEVQRS